MSKTRPLLSLVCVATMGVASACAGATPRATFPQSERTALARLPGDAYAAGRIDVDGLRALPSWAAVREAIARDEPELARSLDRIDRAYFAVGGLVQAPTLPEPSDPEAAPEPRPAWYELSRSLGGRVPVAVAVVEGPAAVELCRLAMNAGEPREHGGQRIAVKEGIAISVEADRFCIATFEPAIPAVFGASATGDGPAVARLAATGRDGNYGLGSVAIALDAPAFAATVAALGPSDGESEESRRWAAVARRIFGVLTHGIDAVSWVARTQTGGYRSEARIVASDADRGTMWREITEIYWDIVRALVEEQVLPAEARASFRTALDGMTLERTDDGFVLAHFLTEEVVGRAIEAMVPDRLVPSEPSVEEEQTPSLMSSVGGSAQTTIAMVEPRLAELDAASHYERAAVLAELASAYASVGRFEDARTVYRRAIGDAEEQGDTDQRATLGARVCELELDYGDLPRAQGALDEARESCEQGSCGVARAAVEACGARILAQRGETDSALAELDRIASETSVYGVSRPLEEARVRILLAARRSAEAAATAHAFRFRPVNGPGTFYALEAWALAGTDAPLDAVLARISTARDMGVPDASTRVSDELDSLLMRIECVARASRAPASTETRSACENAVERSVSVHGESHPETVAARLAFARASADARRRADADAQLRAVDAALEHLGPDNSLRRERAAFAASARRAR